MKALPTGQAPTATDPAISRFATAVRARLADLRADDVDDLTDGLEADLAEKILDQRGSGIDSSLNLGDPEEYADELRSSAGLPNISVRAGRMGLRAELSAHWRRVLSTVRSNAVGAAALDLAISLRPVWWILRGYIFLCIALSIVHRINDNRSDFAPKTLAAWLLLLVAFFVSIQWGRGRFATLRWLRWVRNTATVVAVVAIPFVLTHVSDAVGSSLRPSPSVESTSNYGLGIIVNGNTVTNIFAYDAKGNPLTDVRLFDQNGKPLDAADSRSKYLDSGNNTIVVPSLASAGGSGWNTYPLYDGKWSETGLSGYPTDHALSKSLPTPAQPPFARVRPLLIGDAASAAPDTGTPPATSPSPTPSTDSVAP